MIVYLHARTSIPIPSASPENVFELKVQPRIQQTSQLPTLLFGFVDQRPSLAYSVMGSPLESLPLLKQQKRGRSNQPGAIENPRAACRVTIGIVESTSTMGKREKQTKNHPCGMSRPCMNWCSKPNKVRIFPLPTKMPSTSRRKRYSCLTQTCPYILAPHISLESTSPGRNARVSSSFGTSAWFGGTGVFHSWIPAKDAS